MHTRFDKDNYEQRWQVEVVISMVKRDRSEWFNFKTYLSQNFEMMLRVLTHDVGVILFFKELFHRVIQTYFLENFHKT